MYLTNIEKVLNMSLYQKEYHSLCRINQYFVERLH